MVRFSGGGALLSRNDRVLGTTQHSQVESSQAEKISLQAFLSRREAKGTDEATSLVTLFAELRLGEGATEIANLQAKTSAQELPLPTGEGWGEGSTFNLATVKQLQKPNNVTDLRRVKQKRAAFTLAEVLITLGIIGVVAALTLPALLTNVQSKIKAEQIRSAKYKFSLATEKMARLNLIGPYDSTDAFVDELQKHLKISKRCDVNNLRGCWPYETVDIGDGNTWDIADTKTGRQFGMDTNDKQDYSSNNVGIVTADGVPMILSYNKKCKAIDSLEKLTWSTSDNKPETNDSASCVAAVFEINGTGKPNKISEDVVLFNAKQLGDGCAVKINGKCYTAPVLAPALTNQECWDRKDELGIKSCCTAGQGGCGSDEGSDRWAGAAAYCGGVSKMLGKEDFNAIANQLYKNNRYVSTSGFPSPSFAVWGNEEITYVDGAVYWFTNWRGNNSWHGKDSRTHYGRSNTYYVMCKN